ncbi:MAG: hypothetical protein HDT20_08835 [Oscillibacter sp.]|nr:hypothetical protein [Oscillibacter sp.]
MRNLLYANLRRLVRSRAFLIALLAELAYIVLTVLSCWDHCTAGEPVTLEFILTAGYVLLSYFPISTLIAAPLLSLYLGADYSNSTLRNKLIVGHTRQSVYLADLLACVITAVGLDALYLLVTGVFCAKPIWNVSGVLLRSSAGQMLAWVAVLLLARMAWAAVVKLLATLLGNQTAATIAALLLMLAAAIISTTGLQEISYLSLPQHFGEADYAQRMTAWQLVLDILPTGQYYRVSILDTPNLWRMPLLSLGVIAASTGAGLAFFRRKDLK